MLKYKKPVGLLLCFFAMAAVVFVFMQSDALPALEETAALGHALGFFGYSVAAPDVLERRMKQLREE